MSAGRLVLVVEDEPANQRLFRDLLSRVGYSVVIAGDGRVGVGVAVEQKPALILMDVGLPGISGLEATRMLRGNAATAGIPIVALSAYAMQEDRDKAIKAGCDAFVPKPFDIAELLRVVRNHLGEEAPDTSEGRPVEDGGNHG